MKATIENYMDCKSEKEFDFLGSLQKDDSFDGVESIDPCYLGGDFHSVQIHYY